MGRLKESIVPPGGWTYVSNGVEFREGSPETLIDAITKYRVQNMIPVGDPLRELEDYFCTKYPNQCDGASAVSSVNNNVKKNRFIDRVMKWAQEMYSSGFELVSDIEANNRAGICHACEAQVNWEDECPKCVQDARRLLIVLRKAKEPIVHNLKGCRVWGFDCRTACFMKKQPTDKEGSQPARCWVNK